MSTGSNADRQRARMVAEAARRQAANLGVDLPAGLQLWSLADATPPPPGPGKHTRSSREPGEVGDLARVLETATPAADRQVSGLHVTPDWLADQLVGLAFDGLAADAREPTVCDPACGGGAFLLAAAQALHVRGLDRRHIVRDLLWGADIDALGLATAEAALALWAGEAPRPEHLVMGDALMAGAALWPERPPEGFAAVVGNPPFLNQLGRATVRSREEVKALRDRFGPAVRPYTDTAWLFLLLGVELARKGGRVVLIQPLSLVGARDAAAVRAALDDRAELLDLWVEQGRSFAAAVQVCAPVLDVRVGGAPDGASPNAWAGRLADALGVPAVHSRGDARLADRAAVTAGFRDEYYGLVPLVREARPGPGERPLVTVGVLDWGRSRWGERSAQFAKRRWTAPVVDIDRVDPLDDSPAARGGARWLERVSAPKVVVATQTRVVEAAVDESGTWVPSVPALVVLPDRHEDLWPLAAAIAAPSSTAWLLHRAPGTARSRDALKVAARDLADLPLPDDLAAWADAAEALRAYAQAPAAEIDVVAEAFEAFVAAAAAAYDADEALVTWWRARVPMRFAHPDAPG